MIVGPIAGGIRRPEDLLNLVALHHLRLLQPEPTPDARQALSLVEDARARVLDVLPMLSCLRIPEGSILLTSVTGWANVQDIADDEGGEVIDALSVAYCPDAPMAAAVVAAWRGLAVAALSYRDGRAAWRVVTDAAERSARFTRQAYGSTDRA